MTGCRPMRRTAGDRWARLGQSRQPPAPSCRQRSHAPTSLQETDWATGSPRGSSDGRGGDGSQPPARRPSSSGACGWPPIPRLLHRSSWPSTAIAPRNPQRLQSPPQISRPHLPLPRLPLHPPPSRPPWTPHPPRQNRRPSGSSSCSGRPPPSSTAPSASRRTPQPPSSANSASSPAGKRSGSSTPTVRSMREFWKPPPGPALRQPRRRTEVSSVQSGGWPPPHRQPSVWLSRPRALIEPPANGCRSAGSSCPPIRIRSSAPAPGGRPSPPSNPSSPCSHTLFFVPRSSPAAGKPAPSMPSLSAPDASMSRLMVDGLMVDHRPGSWTPCTVAIPPPTLRHDPARPDATAQIPRASPMLPTSEDSVSSPQLSLVITGEKHL